MNTETSNGVYTHHNEPQPTDSAGVLRVRELLNAIDVVLSFAADHLEDAKKAEADQDVELCCVEANISTCFDLLRDCIGHANRMQ